MALIIFSFFLFIKSLLSTSSPPTVFTVVGMAMKQSEIVLLKVFLMIGYNPN